MDMDVLPITIIIGILSVAAIIISGLSYIVYRQKAYIISHQNSDDETDGSDFEGIDVSEEDELMIPKDRDTIHDLKKQLARVSMTNVRYTPIAIVDQGFLTVDGKEPKEFFEGDVITFRDIAAGFLDRIPDEVDEGSHVNKRTLIVHKYCQSQLRCEEISRLSQIISVLTHICKLVIILRYSARVTLRDEHCEDFKGDLMAIAEWIWREKMNGNDMDIELFSQRIGTEWIPQIVYKK